jgi:hypothetical protein
MVSKENLPTQYPNDNSPQDANNLGFLLIQAGKKIYKTISLMIPSKNTYFRRQHTLFGVGRSPRTRMLANPVQF